MQRQRGKVHWEETVAECLAKDPSQRPQSAAAVANALGLKPTSYATPPVTPAITTTAPGTRKIAPFLIGGVAALLVLAAIGYYGWQRSQRRPPQAATTAQPQSSVSESPPQPTAASPQIAAESPAISVSPVTTPSIAPIAVGSISVSTKPTGADVTIDDQVQTTPASFKLNVGPHTMIINLEGYESKELQIDVRENETTDVGIITLSRLKAVSATASAMPQKKLFAGTWKGTAHFRNSSGVDRYEHNQTMVVDESETHMGANEIVSKNGRTAKIRAVNMDRKGYLPADASGNRGRGTATFTVSEDGRTAVSHIRVDVIAGPEKGTWTDIKTALTKIK